jgi:sterol 3beta-glucosyltransferase
MHITISALGTRGDVQPMIALGKGLQAAGHHIQMIAGSNFESWLRGYGFDFLPTLDMEAVMQSEKGIIWTQRSDNPLKQLQMMRELLHDTGDTMLNPVVEAAQSTDLLLSGFVSEPFIQTVSEKFGVRYVNTTLQPYRSTRSGAASLNPIVPRGDSVLNLLTGLLGQWFIWWVARETTNNLRAKFGLPAHTARSFYQVTRDVPTVFGFSRHVVPPAPEWSENIKVSGYWFLDEDSDWTPSPSLTQFLESGAPPVYIGFGSMSSADPQATLKLILDALQGRRGVIASGWGKLDSRSPLPDNAFVLDKAPHSWLFERVAAVVHHGGAGTTAAGLRAGKPTMIIPHMSDQPYWGRRVYDLGVGVKPVLRHKLTVEALADGITQLTSDRAMCDRAAKLGEAIRAERGVENAVRFIEQWSR